MENRLVQLARSAQAMMQEKAAQQDPYFAQPPTRNPYRQGAENAPHDPHYPNSAYVARGGAISPDEARFFDAVRTVMQMGLGGVGGGVGAIVGSGAGPAGAVLGGAGGIGAGFMAADRIGDAIGMNEALEYGQPLNRPRR